MPKRKKNPYELSDEEKKRGWYQRTIQEAIDEISGGGVWRTP
jgi:hypothetical protein